VSTARPRLVSPVAITCAAGVALSVVAIAAGRWLSSSLDANQSLHQHPDASSIRNNEPSPPLARVLIEGGVLTLSPDDWEAVNKVAHTNVPVAPFFIDRFEVSYGEWAACATCEPIPSPSKAARMPVVHVSPTAAQAFCERRNGRLPTRYEWTYAASGAGNHRYPWGTTGLVCRTAVFGMVNGPCAFGHAAQPVGSRPLGATYTGVADLAGNVAEWASDGERYVAMGGSFRSTLAGQLKVWATEETVFSRDDIGFRCVYAPID
jgi:formylglycine-generating enzyme required for sulfatase activity